MAKTKKKELSFTGHLNNLYYCHEEISEEYLMSLIDQFKIMAQFNHYTMPLFYVIDYTKYKYVLMTEAVKYMANYDPRDFLNNGLGMLLDIYHKEDFKVYNEKVFTANMDFLKTIPQPDHHKYLFSYNFRIRTKSGEFSNVYQRGAYITSPETGLPLYSLGTVIDINNYKQNDTILHTIETFEVQGPSLVKKALVTNHFYPGREQMIFTTRELDVLKYLIDGLSSKLIAEKLHIADHTVNNHRKNMLRKTNAKNLAELIIYAVNHHLI